jgi:hypothetical protein
MYYELGVLIKRVTKDRAFWKDGELWTAVVGGIGAGIWIDLHPDIVFKLREHLGDLLDVTSITFGFALTALFFHVEAIGTWRDHPKVKLVADNMITSHVWTIVCLLVQIGYILAVWTLDFNVLPEVRHSRAFLYGFLTFLTFYCGGQILNHALSAWWAFSRRDVLTKKPNPVDAVADSEVTVANS